MITILQTNQYRDLSSFSEVGTFVPLSTDSHGQLIREVVPARIHLRSVDHPDSPLCLQVALIRDLRRHVPVRPDPEEVRYPSRWDRDLSLDERAWWRENWQATAAPAKEMSRVTHSDCDHGHDPAHRCGRTCTDLHSSLARPGEKDV